MKIQCAFCKGSGKDPFRLMSESSDCQVCFGSGTVEIDDSAIMCVFCSGTGVYPGTRLTCTVCFGKGMITLKPYQLLDCPSCKGSGRTRHSGLPCLNCGGTGKVGNEERRN
ncbi:MAG: hypothetical protein K9L78_02015 [Victivallales bacterium]|nr:hypothetical protein [Victivallales bacterium]